MRAEYDFSKGKRGAAITGKTRISIFIDNAVLVEFRARARKLGTGYQTMMNEALREYLSHAREPITEQVLRNVLRQEMPEYLKGVNAVASVSRRRKQFVGSDKRKGDVARNSKRLLRGRRAS